MGSRQEQTAPNRFALASQEWTNHKFLRDHVERSKRRMVAYQSTRNSRYELLKAMFEREYQDSESYINELDEKIAYHEAMMSQSTSEMLAGMEALL